MKQVLVLACLQLLLTVNAIAATKARWSKTAHDFGLVAESKGTAEALFLLSNDGDKIISILDVNGTCGCTRMQFTRTPIKPGEKGFVRVTFDPRNLLGAFSRKVYVKLKGADSDGATLTLSGTVLGSESTITRKFPLKCGSLYFDTDTVDFGNIDPGSEATVYIEIYNAGRDTVNPALPDLPATVNFTPTPIPPGESRSMEITFKPGAKSHPGDFVKTLTLTGPSRLTIKAYINFPPRLVK